MNEANRNDFRDEIEVDRPHGNKVRSVVKPLVDDNIEFHCDFLVPEPTHPEMMVRFKKSDNVDIERVREAVKEAFEQQYPDINFCVLAL